MSFMRYGHRHRVKPESAIPESGNHWCNACKIGYTDLAKTVCDSCKQKLEPLKKRQLPAEFGG